MSATDTAETLDPVTGTPPEPEPVGPEQWRVDTLGREYVGHGPGTGRRGPIFRQGGETIDEARARVLQDKKPQRKTKPPKLPEAPRQVDLKELERTLAEGFKQPALACAMLGDEWGADHFVKSAPYLARNLIVAAEHNPWLRRQLEDAATGQDAMMRIVSLVGVGGAIFLYIGPPIVYWLNLPVPESARARFGIPPRREREAPDDARAQAAAFAADNGQL
jgi:hypothetical protein